MSQLFELIMNLFNEIYRNPTPSFFALAIIFFLFIYFDTHKVSDFPLVKLNNKRRLVLIFLGSTFFTLSFLNSDLYQQIDKSNSWLSKGEKLFDSGEYQEAIDSFDYALKINPDLSDALYKKGKALEALNRYKEALESYKKTTLADGKNSAAWYRQGVLILGEQHYIGLLKERNYQSPERNSMKEPYSIPNRSQLNQIALQCFTKAIEINQNWDDVSPGIAWGRKGKLLEEMGRTSEALEAYDTSLRLEPSFTLQARCETLQEKIEKETISITSTIENSLHKKVCQFQQ